MLLDGALQKLVAERLGIHRNTLANWMRVPTFRVELARRSEILAILRQITAEASDEFNIADPCRRVADVKGPNADGKWDSAELLVRRSHTHRDEAMGETKTGRDQTIALDQRRLDVLQWHCDRLDRENEKRRKRYPLLAESMDASELLFPAPPTKWNRGGGIKLEPESLPPSVTFHEIPKGTFEVEWFYPEPEVRNEVLALANASERWIEPSEAGFARLDKRVLYWGHPASSVLVCKRAVPGQRVAVIEWPPFL
jgi:hypothetical protein